jgi:hypothetical protein
LKDLGFLRFPRTGGAAGVVVVKQPRHRLCTAASADKKQEEGAVTYNKEFGYSRKDVVIIGVGLIALGYALYYGFQAAGVDPLMAGNFTQLIIILGLCIVWVGSYVFRVMNKVCPVIETVKVFFFCSLAIMVPTLVRNHLLTDQQAR